MAKVAAPFAGGFATPRNRDTVSGPASARCRKAAYTAAFALVAISANVSLVPDSVSSSSDAFALTTPRLSIRASRDTNPLSFRMFRNCASVTPPEKARADHDPIFSPRRPSVNAP